jgi:hypothetical protein
VSLTNSSDDLLIYLNGGGACWDEATCSKGCATNIGSGYDETHGTPAWGDFSNPATFAGTIFDRSDPNNPLRSYNYVHVFYCTGDTHAGSHIASYTTVGRDGQPHPVHHVGYQNLSRYLKALSHTFQPQKVVLAGSSAGGFGSYTGYDVVARTFAAPAYMINDAGPYLENAYWPAGSQALADAWGINAAIPPDCIDCFDTTRAGGGTALAVYLSNKYPNGRMALVTSVEDGHIRQRYNLDGPGFAAALKGLATDVLDPLLNWRYFYMAGNPHTALLGAIAKDTPCGRGVTRVTTPPGTTCAPTLQQFIAQEISGVGWTSATPPPGVLGPMGSVPDESACAIGK